MKQNPGYILTSLNDAAYLLPYGQMIADRKHGIQLNPTGKAIWELLSEPLDLPDLVSLIAKEYQIPPQEQGGLLEDTKTFLSHLINLGMIDGTSVLGTNADTAYLRIAGLTIRLCGPKEAFSKDFDAFLLSGEAKKAEASAIDQTIVVTEELPPLLEGGRYILRNPQLCVCETQHKYILVFPSSEQLKEAHLRKDGTHVAIYCQPPYNESLVYDIFHAIRTMFLYLAGQRRMYAIHSASIDYRQKAWLFSGPSGTGKTTHTNLWNDYLSTPIINGDLNLLAFSGGKPVIHGIPWCGTSGICDTHTYELGGITLLKQESSNCIYPLSEDQKQLLVLQRIISPLWNREMMQQMLSFIKRLSPEIATYKLGCTVSKEAVTTIKAAIDATYN